MPYMEVPWKPFKFVPRFVNLDGRVFLRVKLRLQAGNSSGYAASNCLPHGRNANVWILGKNDNVDFLSFNGDGVGLQNVGDPLYLAGRYTHLMQPATAPCATDAYMLRCFNLVL